MVKRRAIIMGIRVLFGAAQLASTCPVVKNAERVASSAKPKVWAVVATKSKEKVLLMT